MLKHNRAEHRTAICALRFGYVGTFKYENDVEISSICIWCIHSVFAPEICNIIIYELQHIDSVAYIDECSYVDTRIPVTHEYIHDTGQWYATNSAANGLRPNDGTFVKRFLHDNWLICIWNISIFYGTHSSVLFLSFSFSAIYFIESIFDFYP